MDNDRKPGLLSAGHARRWWLLALALLLVIGAGVMHLVQWHQGLRGHELLEYFTLYLALPLAVGILLMFAYLRRG